MPDGRVKTRRSRLPVDPLLYSPLSYCTCHGPAQAPPSSLSTAEESPGLLYHTPRTILWWQAYETWSIQQLLRRIGDDREWDGAEQRHQHLSTPVSARHRPCCVGGRAPVSARHRPCCVEGRSWRDRWMMAADRRRACEGEGARGTRYRACVDVRVSRPYTRRGDLSVVAVDVPSSLSKVDDAYTKHQVVMACELLP